ncbi:MAG: exonuclease, partial [Desulfobacterales bacterium]|nr:exonuclease [Desulfobacterales bacterium]
YPVKVIPKLEADDVMGVISTRSKDKTIIVSEDKDMEQIPGWIFNPNKDEEPRKIGEEQADLKFYIQAASGDPTDNYAGCPGVG